MGKKKPQLKIQPSTSKTPRMGSSNPNSFYSKYPAWRFNRIQMADRWGWHEVDRETITYLREKLSSFESMTWAEILIRDKKYHHCPDDISKLCTEAQSRLSENQIDIESFYSLRLTGEKRVWGILSEGVFSILFWDPKHEICPSTLKHT